MKPFIVSEHRQGTPGWHNDRLGKLTGSRAADIYATRGEGKVRAALRAELVLERILQKPALQSFAESEDMSWGIEQEPFSRMRFEKDTGLDVAQSGFAYRKRIAAGCSVDGFIVENNKLGVWESKSPRTKNHYATLVAREMPPEHRPQVIHNMWVTGAQFAYFSSFDPRLPGNLAVFHQRIERDEDEIDEHERLVLQFLAEVDAEERAMRLLATSEVVIH